MADQDPSLKTQDPPAPLDLIAEGRQSVGEICRASGVSILELAAHVCTPRNLEALARVTQLHAIEREMLLGRLKREALVRLRELTDEVPGGSADEIRAFEVMRKACVDLIRYRGLDTEKSHSRPGEPGEPGGPGGGGPRGYPGGGYHPDTITPAFEAEVLEALERLGEEKNEYEPQGPPRRTSGPFEHPPPAPPPVPTTRLDIHACFNTQPGEEPGAYTSGSLRNGTGVSGGDASGSLRRCTRTRRVPPEEVPPDVPPDVPPLRPLRGHHRPKVGWERLHGGCRAPPSFSEDVVFPSDHDPALAF